MDRSVAFYAPTTQEALVQLLQATQNQLMSQDSALRFLAIDESGNLINAAGGADALRIWPIRLA